jgi:hypothetical protein
VLKEVQTDKRFIASISNCKFNIVVKRINDPNPMVSIDSLDNESITFDGYMSDLKEFGELIGEILKISKV